jgi:hypothetical protein
MEGVVGFLEHYATLTHAYDDFDFSVAKKILQYFALQRMRCEPWRMNELMLVYNMGVHLASDDPAGIFYAIDRIRVLAEQGRPLDVHAFSELLCELQGAVEVATLRLQAEGADAPA